MSPATTFKTLISTPGLARRLSNPNYALVDCSFDLADPDSGRQMYLQAHIPGAVYAHLNRDLSGAPGKSGRHPLPDLEQFQERLGKWGIDAHTQVVVYDQDFGMFAARLWWMLRYLGHEAVAVLDGGMKKWIAEGRQTQSGEEQRPTQLSRKATRVLRRFRSYDGSPNEGMRAALTEVERLINEPQFLLLDARAPERYRGEVEPIDPVAGHIPGAVNHFYQENISPEGVFLPPETLQGHFIELLGHHAPQNVISYCGSGVSACHNLLAMEHAGLNGARLYVGSWSEWCSL